MAGGLSDKFESNSCPDRFDVAIENLHFLFVEFSRHG